MYSDLSNEIAKSDPGGREGLIFSTFFFGVAIGGIMAIKPEGLIITVILGILYFLKQQKPGKTELFIIIKAVLVV